MSVRAETRPRSEDLLMSIGAQVLYTAEEFGRRPDPGYPEELVRGRVVRMPPPGSRHGKVCCNTAFEMRLFLKDHDRGHVLSNDSGVVTEREPDTVRGADVCFYSYERVPKGPLPPGYLDVPPDLVFEVLSPEDRWRKILAKVSEYLMAGVQAVVVLDPERRKVHVFEGDEPTRVLTDQDELTLPSVLGEFRVPVRLFFD
jgi:Uma2 family endonuclease